ncbi:MAG: hypothetical protein ACUVWP_05910 [bacterium]
MEFDITLEEEWVVRELARFSSLTPEELILRMVRFCLMDSDGAIFRKRLYKDIEINEWIKENLVDSK